MPAVCHSCSECLCIRRTDQIASRDADGDISDRVQYHKGSSVKSARHSTAECASSHASLPDMFLSLTASCNTAQKNVNVRITVDQGWRIWRLYSLMWRGETIDYDSYRYTFIYIYIPYGLHFWTCYQIFSINVSYRDRAFVRWYHLRKRRIAVKGLSILSNSKKVKYRTFSSNYMRDFLKDTISDIRITDRYLFARIGTYIFLCSLPLKFYYIHMFCI